MARLLLNLWLLALRNQRTLHPRTARQLNMYSVNHKDKGNIILGVPISQIPLCFVYRYSPQSIAQYPMHMMEREREKVS